MKAKPPPAPGIRLSVSTILNGTFFAFDTPLPFAGWICFAKCGTGAEDA
jgi:hypothetical protein